MNSPISGLVIGVKSWMEFLEIQLDSGHTVHVPKQKDLSFGDKVWVCFDYTTMSVQEVLTDEEYLETDTKEDEPEEVPVDDDWLPAHKTIYAGW